MRTRQFALTIFLSLICSASIWAAPAAPIEIEVSQPDGTTFMVVPRGDEYANWIETTAGHSIVKLNGTWFYAEKGNAGTLRATNSPVGSLGPIELQSMPRHLSPDSNPGAFEPTKVRKIPSSSASNGQDFAEALSISHTQNVLTVLVDYTNQSFTYSDASFQSLIYGAGNSVKGFFLENSYNGFTISAVTESQGVANDGIIHVSRAIEHLNQGGDSSTSRAEAREIVNLADSFIDFAAFDTSGDGVISEDELSIVIIVAGYETSYGGSDFALTPNVWGHRWSFDSTLTLDGVDLRPYTMFGEAHATSGGNKHQATIGIMCHELGHLMLGLPDLYDSDGSSAGIGDWGLMGSGSWNVVSGWSGTSPSHLGAWSKVATGFSTATDIDVDQSGVSFAKADSNEDVKRIWIDKYKSAASYEYLLVENRQSSGFDAGLPASGLMVWHIDESRSNNRDESRKWVDVEAADGQTHLDADTNGGDAGDPFPGSSNNTTFDDTSTPNSKRYSGATTGIGVTTISASSANMTADIAALAGGVGDHVRYDENGFNSAAGFGTTTAWLGVRFLNDTLFENLDGVDVYINDGSGATVDIYYYTSMTGGTPTGLIYSETGVVAGPGWNRLLLAAPQVFPISAERGVVLKVVNDSSNGPIVIDRNGTDAGRSYYDADGIGTFSAMCSFVCSDLNLTVLLSGDDVTAPTATTITPSTTGPTNAQNVSFDISFSEDVVNFNNSSDVVISHSGTSHSGVSISGSGSSYTANVTGISGDGSFTLAVDSGSDIEDTSGLALSGSVTSASVSIDNTGPAATVVAPSATGPTNANSMSFDVTFNADVVSFNNSTDVVIVHTGTAHSGVNITGSGSSYSVDVSGISGEGSFTLAVNTASDVQDVATNALVSSVTSAAVNIDNTAPTVSIGTASAMTTNGDPVSYTVTYEGASAITLASGDITLNKTGSANGAIAVTGEGATSRTVTINNIVGVGTLGISMAMGTATDSAGNSAEAAGPSGTFDVDSSDPSATIITPSTTGPTNSDSVSFDITFSEDVVNFNDAADVVVSHTDTSHTGVNITGSGSSYSVDVSGIEGDGSFTLAVSAVSDVQDTANNALDTSVTSAAVNIDNTSPSVSIGAASAGSTNTGPVSFIVTYLEADVVTLAAGDITLNKSDDADGSIAVTGEGATTRTITISDISGDGTLGISIGLDTASDSAGNNAAAAGPSGTFDVDNTAPTVLIGPASIDTTMKGPVSYTITYTDADTITLAAGDITLNKTDSADGSIAVTGEGATSRTVTISNITGDGSLGISIGAGSASDSAGNEADAAAPSETFSVIFVEQIFADDFE